MGLEPRLSTRLITKHREELIVAEQSKIADLETWKPNSAI
jgi:hypothetical protein